MKSRYPAFYTWWMRCEISVLLLNTVIGPESGLVSSRFHLCGTTLHCTQNIHIQRTASNKPTIKQEHQVQQHISHTDHSSMRVSHKPLYCTFPEFCVPKKRLNVFCMSIQSFYIDFMSATQTPCQNLSTKWNE